MEIKGLVAALSAAVLLAACSDDQSVRVGGRFAGHSDKKIYLEQVLPGDQKIVDSTTLGRKGDFCLTVKTPGNQTTLYNLRYSTDVIPLFLSPGEKVTINSICDISHNYTVEGSPESERLRELKMLLSDGSVRLDSLRTVILNSEGEEQINAYGEMIRETQRVMREHLSFIITRPDALSSLYALYQRLPGQQHLFTSESDVLYYRMIADSTGAHFPESPYVIALRKEVSDADNQANMLNYIAERLAGDGDNYPDLDLPDMYGNNHMLSSLQGNVILLDFWLSTLPAAKLNNAEMRQVYDKSHEQGFEIYQVSLDTQKAQWVLAVQNQKLPWITVCDLKGNTSPALRLYNVSKVPTNFLIDRRGNIVARDIYGDALAKEVAKLL